MLDPNRLLSVNEAGGVFGVFQPGTRRGTLITFLTECTQTLPLLSRRR